MNTNLGDGAQTGDWQSRDSAGRDIYQGLSGEQLRALMQQQSEFYLTLVSAYERHATDTARKIEHLRNEHDIYRTGEAKLREARQQQLDRRLTRIEGAIALLILALLLLAWRLWPAITAVAAMAARH